MGVLKSAAQVRILSPPFFQKIVKKLNRTTEKKDFIKIFVGADLSSRQLAYLEIKSPKAGPVVWLTAGIHGDEVGGVAAVHEIFKKLRRVGLLKGKVCAFPLINPTGFNAASRQLASTREDLNRVFPGKPNGTLAERLAAEVFEKIKNTGPAVVIDLHNDWQNSVGHILIDNCQGRVKTYAKQLGLPIIQEEKSKNQNKTLSGSLLAQGIPALVIETCGTYVVNEKELAKEARAIFNLLSFWGMIKIKQQPIIKKQKILRYSEKPICRTSGLIRFLVKPGDIVRAGQPVAVIQDALGKIKEILKAPAQSLVLGYYNDSAVAWPGRPVLAFGIIK